MNFFEQQEQARKQTRTLMLLFVLAVATILAAVNGAMALIWTWGNPMPQELAGALSEGTYPRGFFFVNTFITLLLIGGGTLFEMVSLRDGGDAVAKMAGGRLVAMESTEQHEQRLVNVVQEMALASGVACPRVYVLDREESINAFAAGYNANEAVVAVTRGTLRRLTRDELQGVVAHEFSHILNGDMRLNVRLIGVLFGIQMLATLGQHLLDIGWRIGGRSGKKEDKGISLQIMVLAVGVALFVIGYIGIFFGRLIKAAVSRQREFLADASAVQFTRNPETIGGALQKIGGLSREKGAGAGSRIDNANAEQLSHLFLGAARPQLIAGLFATHPPIEERLRRIYGKQVALRAAPEIPPESVAPAPRLPDIPFLASGFAEAVGDMADQTSPIAHVFGAGKGTHPAVAELDQAVRETWSACALAYAVLLEEGAQRAQQMAILKADAPQAAGRVEALATALGALPKAARLPLLDMAMPALRQMAQAERERFLGIVAQLVAADQRVTLAEFVVQTVLERRLAVHAGRATPVRFHKLSVLTADLAVLLSLVSHVAGGSPLDAFLRGIAQAPDCGLSITMLRPAESIDFAAVRSALVQANQLAPLQKPLLIKLLLAGAASPGQPLGQAAADLLRALCAALDAPVPPAVAQTYTDSFWS